MTLPIGGAEQLLLTILKNIDKTRYEPTVCCINSKGPIGLEIEKLGFEVIELGRKSKSWDIRIVLDLMALIRRKNIDILHTHLYHANMYGRVAASRCNVPVIITEHNVYTKYKLKRRLVNYLLAKKTDRIIAVSRMVMEYVIRRDWIERSKVELIYNGIDIPNQPSETTREQARKELGLSEEHFVIGTVSRLEEQKGHNYLIDAVKKLKDSIPNLKVLIVGSGTLELHLKKRVEDEGLKDYIDFLGPRRNIPDLLRSFDVFVFPSLWEGLPVALLEALACSLPAIVTPVGGVGEIIEDGINGIFVPPRDSDSLEKAVLALYNDRELRGRLGNEGQRTVFERFNAALMVKKLESLYREVIDSHTYKI